MPYRLKEHTQTLDFDVTGEPPMEMPFSRGARLTPTGARVLITDGKLDLVSVYGPGFTASGAVSKRRELAGIGEAKYAPAWLLALIAEAGLSFDDMARDIAAETA